DLDPDPLVQFRAWYAEAEQAGLLEPNAMTISTVDDGGRPAARYVLLRGLDDEHGFQFFTNLQSAKARDLGRRPAGALTFGWLELQRQGGGGRAGGEAPRPAPRPPRARRTR